MKLPYLSTSVYQPRLHSALRLASQKCRATIILQSCGGTLIDKTPTLQCPCGYSCPINTVCNCGGSPPCQATGGVTPQVMHF
jgi:hypothetical protein